MRLDDARSPIVPREGACPIALPNQLPQTTADDDDAVGCGLVGDREMPACRKGMSTLKKPVETADRANGRSSSWT
jgi:hypothetical protein